MSVFRKLSAVVPGRRDSKTDGNVSPTSGQSTPRRSIAAVFHRGDKEYTSSTESETDSDLDGMEGLSKNAAKRQIQKERKKEAKSRLSHESRDHSEERATQRLEEAKAKETDEMRTRYGELPLMQSNTPPQKLEERIDIINITGDMVGQEVVFRCRLHHSRNMSQKLMFLIFRQQISTIQGVLHEKPGEISPVMIHWAEHLRTGTIMRVRGTVQKPNVAIKSASIHDVEIHVTELKVIQKREEASMYDQQVIVERLLTRHSTFLRSRSRTCDC